MKSLILTILNIVFCLFLMASFSNTSAESENIDIVERIIDPSLELRRTGLYRVIDHKAGYIIYVLTTGQSGTVPEIIAVPIQQ